jgi:phosphodiester glycosidase
MSIRGLAGALAAALPLTVALPAGSRAADSFPPGWTSLEPGLDFGVFTPSAASAEDSSVRVLRIDPRHFALRLLNASAPGENRPLTVREWCRRNDLVAGINASMYQTDYRTSVSLMKTKDHTNNPRLSRDKAVLAFDRRDDGVPPVQIIDRQYQNLDELGTRYDTLVQSIRMVALGGANVWQPQPQKSSTAAIGVDRLGRVLFVHVSAPYSTHDLIDTLLALPLDLRNAMYVEGGPEAQLYVRSGRREVELVGRFDSTIVSTDASPHGWPVPNVIGAVRRGTD